MPFRLTDQRTIGAASSGRRGCCARCAPDRPVAAVSSPVTPEQPGTPADLRTGGLTCAHTDLSKQSIMLRRLFRSPVSAPGRMNGLVNSPDAFGEDPCTVTGIRAINEPGEGLVELEIAVGCSRASLWKDRPGEHPSFSEFRHRVRLVWKQGQMGSDPDGWIRIEVPRGQLEDVIQVVRQAARDTDAEYQALLARRREYPCASRRLNARGRPTRPGVAAWQKIRPASTRCWPRQNSSSCCRVIAVRTVPASGLVASTRGSRLGPSRSGPRAKPGAHTATPR